MVLSFSVYQSRAHDTHRHHVHATSGAVETRTAQSTHFCHWWGQKLQHETEAKGGVQDWFDEGCRQHRFVLLFFLLLQCLTPKNVSGVALSCQSIMLCMYFDEMRNI